jgi:hypothetical protein
MGPFSSDFVGGSTGAADFSSLLGNAFGGPSARPADLSSILGGAKAPSGDLSGQDIGSAVGALAFGAAGSAFGIPPELSGKLGAAFGKLFGGAGVPDHERSDLGRIAANNNITEDQASAVCGYEESHVKDNYDTICARAAGDNSYFLGLLSKYNAAHPQSIVTPGPTVAQVAAQQQQLLTTATTTLGFGATATGQQLVKTLQALPSSEPVGTQGQTAGDVLGQIIKGMGDGLLKGGSDAAAETDMGKSMKADYIKTWLKENQLLAGVIAAALGFTAYKAYGPKGKISL